MYRNRTAAAHVCRLVPLVLTVVFFAFVLVGLVVPLLQWLLDNVRTLVVEQ